MNRCVCMLLRNAEDDTCAAVCCRQCVSMCSNELQYVAGITMQSVAVLLQCVAGEMRPWLCLAALVTVRPHLDTRVEVYHWHFVTVRCSVLQCVAACCSVLQPS